MKPAMYGKKHIPDPIRYRKLMMARKLNNKKQLRENRARKIEEHHRMLEEEYGWIRPSKRLARSERVAGRQRLAQQQQQHAN